jgi:transcriptional regulator with XRE-family HTH domain
MLPPAPHPPRALHPVRAYRVRRRIPQWLLAERAGITEAGLSRIETLATELPSIAVIARLVLACDGEVSAIQIFRHHFAVADPTKRRKPPTRARTEGTA